MEERLSIDRKVIELEQSFANPDDPDVPRRQALVGHFLQKLIVLHGS